VYAGGSRGELRRAFDASIKDPELVEAARKQKLKISPMTGTEVQNSIKQVLAAPAEIKQDAKTALGIPSSAASGPLPLAGLRQQAGATRRRRRSRRRSKKVRRRGDA
jgi:hypothetical protein